jgi:hypothetical protein
MSIAQKIVGFLGGLYNLFPLGGTKGGIIVRQPGGVAGSAETQIWNDGTKGNILFLASDTTTAIAGGNGDASCLTLTSKFGLTLAANNGRNIFANNTLVFNSSGVAAQHNFTGGVMTWPATNGGTIDTAIGRVAAGVVGPYSGSSGTAKGWLQNSAGEAALAANFTNATATLNNTNLSLTVIAGRSYRIEGILQVSNSVAGEGCQFDFNGGAATATTFWIAADSTGTNTPGTVVATALNGAINFSSVTGTNYIRVRGYLKCNAAGTLILRFSENSSSTGTATLGAGSWIALADTVTL